ncbi:MAG TPA: hypothetical protein VN365_08250 [Candidatus Thermoplasmatota archaeon]|nr:hypothetical protein [Candidatus Thermoplasmatota archaeon]
MKTMYRLLGVVAIISCVFLLTSIPLAQAKTDTYTDSMVIIMGQCDTVSSPALWLFGFKFLLNRHIYIQANGGANEKLTALILPSKIGFYFGQADMIIQLDGAKGLFFRGEKAWVFQNNPQRIFAICKASFISVTYV